EKNNIKGKSLLYFTYDEAQNDCLPRVGHWNMMNKYFVKINITKYRSYVFGSLAVVFIFRFLCHGDTLQAMYFSPTPECWQLFHPGNIQDYAYLSRYYITGKKTRRGTKECLGYFERIWNLHSRIIVRNINNFLQIDKTMNILIGVL
ncbi:hypothetical protein ACJX0J_034280, partial [Zea mays]